MLQHNERVQNIRTGKTGTVVSHQPIAGRYRVRWDGEYYWPRVPLITPHREEELKRVPPICPYSSETGLGCDDCDREGDCVFMHKTGTFNPLDEEVE